MCRAWERSTAITRVPQTPFPAFPLTLTAADRLYQVLPKRWISPPKWAWPRGYDHVTVFGRPFVKLYAKTDAIRLLQSVCIWCCVDVKWRRRFGRVRWFQSARVRTWPRSRLCNRLRRHQLSQRQDFSYYVLTVKSGTKEYQLKKLPLYYCMLLPNSDFSPSSYKVVMNYTTTSV